jgi:hypothetical protein
MYDKYYTAANLKAIKQLGQGYCVKLLYFCTDFGSH